MWKYVVPTSSLSQLRPRDQPILPYSGMGNEMKSLVNSPTTVLMPKVKAIDVIGGKES